MTQCDDNITQRRNRDHARHWKQPSPLSLGLLPDLQPLWSLSIGPIDTGMNVGLKTHLPE